jgi:hypothetical protein
VDRSLSTDSITTVDLVSNGDPNEWPNFLHLNFPNFTFEFGKSYLLDGWPWHGGDTLSWLIGGRIDHFTGKLSKNTLPYTIEERRKEAWCVGWSRAMKRKFPFRDPTIQEQIGFGLTASSNPYFKTEAEIIDRFKLTIERYNRPQRQLSKEGWRASCAVGLVNSRRVFCFPYMLPDIVNLNAETYLFETLRILTEAGALVLLPTTAIGIVHPEKLVDEIVPVKHDSGSVILYKSRER